MFVHARLLLNISSIQGVQSQQSLQMILNAGVARCICWLGVDCAPNQPSMPSPEGNTCCQIKFSFFTLQALVKTISCHSVLRSIFYCFLCKIKLQVETKQGEKETFSGWRAIVIIYKTDQNGFDVFQPVWNEITSNNPNYKSSHIKNQIFFPFWN